MNISNVYEQMTGIFRDLFDDDSITLTPETTADDIEDWDSLTHIRLILALETAFKVRFSTVELGGLKKVGDLADLIVKKSSDA